MEWLYYDTALLETIMQPLNICLKTQKIKI